MAKMSENSVKLLAFLKANAGKKMTSKDVAAELGIPEASVNGAFTAFSNKELGIREPGVVDGTATVKFLKITDKARGDISEISEMGQAIIKYLIDTDNAPATAKDVAEALGTTDKKVNGAFNGLVKKELGYRDEATVAAKVEVKYLVLTEAGMAYDPEADAE